MSILDRGSSAIAILLAVLTVAGCGRDLADDISATASADGIVSVRIIGEAGDIQIIGEDRSDIALTGRAFAGTRAELDLLEFGTLVMLGEPGRTDGNELLIEILTPGNTEIDAVIRLPEHLDIIIEDGSGDIDVQNVGDLNIVDASGDIDIDNVAAVVLEDDSGDIRIERVARDVAIIRDDSGDIRIERVSQNVTISTDSSGDIWIDRVTMDVTIGQDSSGDITVDNVGGDFTVENDGSGEITFNNVVGRVSLP